MKPKISISALLLLAGAIAASSRPSQRETRSYVFTKDNTTGGGETFTRRPDSVGGEIALGKARIEYAGHIATDGSIPRLDLQISPSGGAKTRRFISMIVAHDSVEVIDRAGARIDTFRLAAAPGTIPLFDPSIGLYEVIVARARSHKSRSATVPMSVVKIDADDLDKLSTGSLRSLVNFVPGQVTFLSADTVVLGNTREKDKVRLIVGSDGRVRSGASGADANEHFSMRPTSKPVPLR